MSLKKEQVGKIIVTGQDADVQGVNNLINGSQSMTIYKPIAPLATRAAVVAMELAKTKKVANIEKVKVGELLIYAELLAPVVVDKNNYKETVVKDGQVQLSELIGNE
jgi:D-xylose transport system substrate-binding protein